MKGEPFTAFAMILPIIPNMNREEIKLIKGREGKAEARINGIKALTKLLTPDKAASLIASYNTLRPRDVVASLPL